MNVDAPIHTFFIHIRISYVIFPHLMQFIQSCNIELIEMY